MNLEELLYLYPFLSKQIETLQEELSKIENNEARAELVADIVKLIKYKNKVELFLARLNAQEKKFVELRYFERKSIYQICDELSISHTTCWRLNQKIKKLLDKAQNCVL